MTSYIYKPATYKGPVFLAPDSTDRSQAPVITDANGTRYTGTYVNTNEGRHQWKFPNSIAGLSGLTLNYGGQSTKIASGAQSYEGDALAGWKARAKGSLAGGGGPVNPGGQTNYQTNYQPGSDPTGHGFFPADLTGQFPSPFLASYNPITSAPYQFTDPMQFAQQYGDFNRGQFTQNNELAKQFAFDQLNSELQGLSQYAPAVAALKRQQTSLDNQFNQYQRSQQVNQALPGAQADLAAQRQRANIYASGGIPDPVLDRALNISAGSAGADQASAGGFGALSAASRNVQGIMSVQDRLKLSQYGEGLLGNNINERASLFLAPTEYSNAGSQLNVTPPVSVSQLQSNARNELNQFAGIPATTALSSQIQQNQFTTGLEQQTRQFNAGNQLQLSEFNTGQQNTFALDKFGYQVGQANAVASGFQTGANTQLQLQQQQQALQIAQMLQNQAQQNQQLSAILQGIAALGGAAGGISGIASGITSGINTIASALGSGSSSSTGADSSLPTGNTTIPPFGTSNSTPDLSLGADLSVGATSPEAGAGTSDTTIPTGETNISPDGNISFGNQQYAQTLGRHFSTDTGVQVSPSTASALTGSSNALLRSAGISSTPGPNKVSVGLNYNGQQVYTDRKLGTSNDTNVGNTYQKFFSALVDPMGVLDNKDKSALDKIGAVSSDVGFLANLTNLYQQGDKKGFVNAVLQQYKKPIVDNLTEKDTSRSGLNAAFGAYNLFANWDKMSGAQKSLGLANLGLQTYHAATGVNLAQQQIPGTGTNGTPALNVGQALNLFQSGYDVYSLVNNWHQYSDIQKVAVGSGTVAQLANTAQSLGLTGNASLGGANLVGAGSIAGGIAGVAGVALGAQAVYKGWGEGGTRGAEQGAIGGAALAGGLYALGATNPYLLAGIAAVSIAGDAIKTGKSGDQMGRDSIRSVFKKNGLSDKDYNVTLADGSKFNVGIDGHGGYHSVTDASKLTGKANKLNAWDLDYTNDLDYASGMGGIALSRILSGGKAKNIDQLGNQLGNAAISNIGYGKDLSFGNYTKMVANQRSMYAKAGISTKQDAYSLAQQAFKEGRINSTDLVTMQQGFNMVFDDPRSGYQTIQKLMGGRFRGLDVANNSSQAGEGKKPNVTLPDSTFPSKKPAQAFPFRPGTGGTIPSANTPQTVPDVGFQTGNKLPPSFYPRSANLTPAEMKEINRRRYQQGVTY